MEKETPQSEKESLASVKYEPFKELTKRIKKNKLAVAGFFLLCVIFAIAILFWVFDAVGFYWPYDPNATSLSDQLQGPSTRHLLGTDHLGRDILTRMLYGARISLMVGFVAVAVSLTIGIFIGSIAGYFGGIIDSILMRFVDSVMCFPSFFLILTVLALTQGGILVIMLIIGLTSWTGTARFVRAEFLSLKEREFVQAAKATGARTGRIIFRHIFPNALAPVLVTATIGVATAILIEATLSFLGLGVKPPAPTWGNIIYDGKRFLAEAPWMTIFPSIAIFITVLAFNLFGEGLRDALDPRLKYGELKK